MTAIPITSVAEPYIRLRATHHLEKGYIVIFAGGTVNLTLQQTILQYKEPSRFIVTLLFVAKQGVDGVLNADPKLDKDARKFRSLHYNDVLKHNLKVMDQSAFILARDYNLPMHVFNFDKPGTMKEICEGNNKGTIISGESILELE